MRRAGSLGRSGCAVCRAILNGVYDGVEGGEFLCVTVLGDDRCRNVKHEKGRNILRFTFLRRLPLENEPD